MKPNFKAKNAPEPQTQLVETSRQKPNGTMQVTERFANALAFLNGIENIDPQGTRQYFTPSGFQGVVRLTNYEIINTDNNGPAFVAEVEIVTNDSENGVEKVGHRYSIYKGFGKFPNYAKSMMVSLVYAFSGVDIHDSAQADTIRQMRANMKELTANFINMDYDKDPHYAYLVVKPSKNEKFPDLIFSAVQEESEEN